MHPEEIKAAIRIRGVTPAVIADHLGLTPSTVSRVIHGDTVSARVRQHIAELIGKPVATLWPPKNKPVMVRRRGQAKEAA